MKILLCVVSYVLFLSATATLQAQPANDNFASRIVVSGGQLSVSGTTVGGSREANEPAPFFGMGPSVWYEWVAPASSSTTVAITGSYREFIGAYTGTVVSSLTAISTASAGNGGTTASFTFTPVAGTAYKLLVSGRFVNGGANSGTFTLTITQAVSVNITAPANNTAVAIGTPVVIDVSATVPNPPVARVDFYRGGSLIGTDTTAPYSFTNTPIAGNNSYTAVGVDNSSLSYTSLAVNVSAVNPGAFITAPADGATILNLNPLTVSALVLTASGTVTNVDFYVDGAKFADDTTSPFSVSWGGVTVGAHLFTVIGKLDNGINYTSAPVAVAVARSLMASNSNWKYLDNGSDQGTAWVASGFNDSSWVSGPAPLGYGDSGTPARPVLTTVSFGPDTANKYPTTYFRQSLLVTNVASYTNIVLRMERDDSLVLYLNGNEVYRNNIAAGQTYLSFATADAGDDGAAVFTFTVPASQFIEGTNVLAAEIHQSNAGSSDIWFVMDLLGVPVILRNQFPTVVVTSPTNNSSLLAPASIAVAATAADTDGTVTNVSFRVQDIFGNEIALGNDATAPYEATWNSPTQGWYTVYAIASDNEGANGTSAGNFITVFDAIGTPRIQIFNPTNGSSFNGPTNVNLFAGSTSPNGVTNVEYRANGSFIGRVVFPTPTSPANVPFTWTNANSGTSILTAVSFDASGLRGTSAPVTIVVVPPPPNLAAPAILSQNPPAAATLTNLTSIQVLFTELVTGVNASDLLVNGTPATGLSGSGSNYTFTVTQPAAGAVNITWVSGHGILDLGIPQIPFDETEVGQSWSYTIIDGIPPVIASRVPAAGATVTNLTQITVNFSEVVQGVDASDLFINGSPAVGLSGGPTSYTFGFAQPVAGTVNLSWDGAHGISDLASPPNAFNAAAASWSYTLDLRTILVQSNANWLFVKGLVEASSPRELWRTNTAAYNDTTWSNAPAPFYYGDPYNSVANPGTLLSDMLGSQPTNYSSIYLRKRFVVANASAITNLYLVHQSDDGYIAWINGIEVFRYNMGPGEIAYNGTAPSAVTEVPGGGAPYLQVTLPNPAGYLVEGTNILAIHAFNNNPTSSSDFGINAQLYTFLTDLGTVPPRLATVVPSAGDVLFLTNITVAFTEPVSGVNAGDLLINGAPATSVSSTTNSTYTFHFAQPAFGPVSVTWLVGHGIADLDMPPKPFDSTAGGSTFGYTLINPSAPTIASQTPLAGASVTNLTQVTVNFSEAVTGVDAGDFRINGAPATGVSGGPVNYTFTFAQPAYGPVTLGWSLTSNIRDLEMPANDFDPARSGNSWSLTLVDQIPPVIAAKNPAASAVVTNLTTLTVTFTEAVNGVGASDLLINDTPATGVSGSGAGPYTFTFAQPNATVINITWAAAHGITDQATAPNAFNRSGFGATWSYTTPDTLAPALALVEPTPFVTVKSLTQISVTFTEPVTGVDTNDLLMNGVKARQLAGSGAGPYTFTWLPPAVGPIDVRWSLTHGITDLALPSPNPFPGGEWTYTYDPSANFAGKILFNEIMFDALGGAQSNEWVELRNISTNLINLAGWRFSKGVGYTFPNRSLPTNGYLVVAANLAAFQLKYPGVTNAIGGWTGSLANTDETLELQTALGEVVNTVHYASEGDWARRERGQSAEPVDTITRSGSTATVNFFDHGYTANDQVIISGADQPEYNGRFIVGGIGNSLPITTTPSSFTITVPGTPATPATGRIECRRVLDDGFGGWFWYSAANGFGPTLELVNAALPNTSGQNWLSSTNAGGTPGRANSVATNNVAPLIESVTHFPPVPRSTEPVAITARLRDELVNGIASAQLIYRNHTGTSPGGFLSTNLLDNGTTSDGLAGDGLYGAVLPAAANGTVIEFYVQATDTGGRVRTWPAPAMDTNGVPAQLANALYRVDNETPTNNMPVIRAVLSGTEVAGFPPGSRNSDSAVNLTLISTDGDGVKIRYLCDARIRGAGSRSRTPPNNRIGIPNDNRWNGRSSFNLNCQFVHAQMIGNVVAAKAGLPNEEGYVVQYRINGGNPAPISAPVNGTGSGAGWGVYLLLKPTNGDLLDELYPENAGGNVYRASTGNHNADLSYRGTNPDGYLTRGYTKNSNSGENDWTDLMRMTTAFSFTGSEADYAQSMRTNVNVEMWMRYFALGSLMNFGETALFNGRGDDFGLYRGSSDPRFLLLPHDFDTIFGQGDTGSGTYSVNTNSSIYIMLNPPNGNANVPLLRNFMTNAAFAPLFFAELKRLADTVFHPSVLRLLMDQHVGTNLWGVGPDGGTVAAMKDWAESRRQIVLSQIPLALSVGSTLSTQSGYLSTVTPGVTLFGTSHAIDTRRVLVNGSPARWAAWDARWTNTITLQPGLNRVLVQSLNSNNVEFARATVDIWYDDGGVQSVSGAIAADTTWTAANGPYEVTGSITVNNGVTLTIQAGTTLYLASGVNITVANGGRILAEGTETAPIRFSRTPGAATSWGGMTVNGGAGSPETRITHAHFEFNGSAAIDVNAGTVFLDHLTFGNTAVQYLSLDGASFVVQNCVFPATTAGFEPVHGTQGIKAGGRGIVRRNFWGKVIGYNDAFDFTGGNRPGPILQVINNVFAGSDDDLLDFDSTDAWVEGNIFLHVHRNGSPDSASAVSGGSDNASNSEITMVGNLFYDVDQAANAKQTNFYTMVNNTIVFQNRIGSQDANAAVVILADDGTPQGAGIYLEGNLIYDAENLTRNVTTALVTYTNNLIRLLQGTAWSGPGGNNSTNDPLLSYIPQLAETTNFSSWAQAQVMKTWFSLRPGSPASGSGPNGRDQGGVIPLGASISGEPVGVTPLTTATLRVGALRTGSGIPVNGFPNGSGYTHYKWRLDGGPWSAETPTATLLTLSGLSSGAHYVEVSGKNDAGFYQDDAIFGADATVSRSRTWTVNPSAVALRLNEVLASNAGVSNHFGTTPDLIELWNSGGSTLDLSGMGLTDDVGTPAKFLFPNGTMLAAGAYLTVFANNADGTSGLHLGFSLNQGGDELYLYNASSEGGALIDSIRFGMQLTDLSIGRLADGSWALTQPTFSGPNRAAATGDARNLRINEWLAIAQAPFNSDFVELHNLDARPVALGGLFFSDEIVGNVNRHTVVPLSFIAGNGYLRFLADGDAGAGADHLNFKLSGEQGGIGLYLPDLSMIDCVVYGPQLPNISQGRSPNGSSAIVFFDTPTPGAPNPLVSGPAPNGGVLVINEVLAVNASLAEGGRTPDWIELYNGSTNLVNLADRSLTDNSLQARKFVFAPGTTLAAGGFLRVVCDPGATNPGALTTTNFALSGSGGTVYLFDALGSGGSLLNAISYGLQVPNLSLGRVPDGSTNWVLTSPTAAASNEPVPTLGDPAVLRVNEWMANPGQGKDDWFEVYNPGLLPVSLGNLFLSDDLGNRTKHRITPLSFIGFGTNGFIQFRADGNVGAGADHVSFSLGASGEAVGISSTNATLLDGYVFGAQSIGVSQGRFPDGNSNVVFFPGTDSPAASNYRLLTTVAINEALTHTDEPLEDAIELRNLTGAPIDVSGWWLSDDNGTLQKYVLPFGTVLPAHGFTVIYETHFTNATEAAVPFALGSGGDDVVLSAATNGALTGFRARVKFGAAANGVSFGRYVTSDGVEEFTAMSTRTFGADDPASVTEFRTGTGKTNAYPRVGPVLISEIMYHPPDMGTNDDTMNEFIELFNAGTTPVQLYDPDAPTNTWHLRDAVDFNFPTGLMLPAGGTLLVVSFDPINNPGALAAFRAHYMLDPGQPITGPWSGKLANDNDEIELRRPDAPNTNDVPYILVEHVHYYDNTPWTPLADGTGFSLQRVSATGFANDSTNWVATTPSPGPLASSTDTDGDGMPNDWEIANGFDPFNPNDAALDTDGDGLTNVQEYQLGTDPRDASSALRITSVALSGGNVVLTFNAASNIVYNIDYTDALGTTWFLLQQIPAASTNRVIIYNVPASLPMRFFRLRLGAVGSQESPRFDSWPAAIVPRWVHSPARRDEELSSAV